MSRYIEMLKWQANNRAVDVKGVDTGYDIYKSKLLIHVAGWERVPLVIIWLELGLKAYG